MVVMDGNGLSTAQGQQEQANAEKEAVAKVLTQLQLELELERKVTKKGDELLAAANTQIAALQAEAAGGATGHQHTREEDDKLQALQEELEDHRQKV
jgi:hypothetical protein